ncbi:MAG: D-aminoacylase [Planctomycetota bacterium]
MLLRRSLLVFCLFGATCAPSSKAPFDLVFFGGTVIDGSGSPRVRADVGVRGDRIAEVGDLARAAAKRRIDATGLVIAPGFIDMLGWSEYRVLVDPRAASKITQGITTELTGEGTAIAPTNARMIAEDQSTWKYYGVTPTWTTLRGYWAAFERARPTINLGTFVGAGGVRDLVIGREDRPPTAAELAQMEAAVAEAMEDGAFGLSSSLIYVPDSFASAEELIALARVAARFGGRYITHQRSEDDELDASLTEVFRIAREAQIPAEIYHLKTAGRGNWGRMPEVLARIEDARAEGLDVTANHYPWSASSNGLDASLPAWVREGSRDALVARLRDPAQRARIRAELEASSEGWVGGDIAERILITSVLEPTGARWQGRRLAEIARDEHKDAIDALMDIVLADRGNTGRVTFSMSEDDVRAALVHPLVTLCTDSGASAEDGILSQKLGHPRGWGSTTRILGHYVREEQLLTLEAAVQRMTSVPAERMGLVDRGRVQPGMLADLAVFDPKTVSSKATYEDPRHYSTGVPYVAVNGALVVDGGQITDARPGRPLHGPGWRSK